MIHDTFELCTIKVLNVNLVYLRRIIMTHLKVGDRAPDFTLPSHLDSNVSLRELRGKVVALAFFPQAWTPI